MGMAIAEVDRATRMSEVVLRGAAHKIENQRLRLWRGAQCALKDLVKEPAEAPLVCRRVLTQSKGNTTSCAQARATAPESMSVAKLVFGFNTLACGCGVNFEAP